MLKACPVPEKRKSHEIIDAFIAGAPKSAEGRCFYGVKESNVAEWRAALRSGEPWWWCDNSYFDRTRGERFRVTRNDIQHTGKGESDGKRFAALGLRVREERYPSPPGWVLVCPQSPVHMRLVANAAGWVEGALERFGPLLPDGRETIFRVRPWSSDKLAAMSSLQADLARASYLVTHSSAAAVEAVLAGVQVVVSPMSCAHSLGTTLPSVPERLAWAEVLADNEWSKDEMRSGMAWRMLNP